MNSDSSAGASVDQWWPLLQPGTRQWLIGHNGEELSADVLEDIAAAGGVVTGSRLPDDSIDWIEATANGETPEG